MAELTVHQDLSLDILVNLHAEAPLHRAILRKGSKLKAVTYTH